jgi:hypothetical protein
MEQTLKYLPGQLQTGKIYEKNIEHRQVGDKTVTTFKLVINNRKKDDKGNWGPKMVKNSEGAEVESTVFIRFETWSDAVRAKLEQAVANKGCSTVVKYEVEPHSYTKDGKVVFTEKRSVIAIGNYKFENDQQHLISDEEMPF